MTFIEWVKLLIGTYVLVFMFFPGLLLMIVGVPLKEVALVCLKFDVLLWVVVFIASVICKCDGKCYFCRNSGESPCEGTPGGN